MKADIPDDERLAMECRIHDLLCDEVSEEGRRGLLDGLPYTGGMRDLACEMLEVQNDARRAFGYEGADRALRASLRRLLARLHGGGGKQRETRGPDPFSSLAVGHGVG